MTERSNSVHLYDRLAPLVGHDTFMREFARIGALIDDMIRLVQEAEVWAEEHGYPEVEDYPQYTRMREIGLEIHRLASFKGMQSALKATQRRLDDLPPVEHSYAIVTYGWAGIGGWQP